MSDEPRITAAQVVVPAGFSLTLNPVIDREKKTISPLACVMLSQHAEKVAWTHKYRESTMKIGDQATEGGAICNAAVNLYGMNYYGGFLCGLAGEPDFRDQGRFGQGWADGAKVKRELKPAR